jgi:hypothetical protein
MSFPALGGRISKYFAKGPEAMNANAPDPAGTATLEQGDPGLLRSDVAKRLLASSLPARYAYMGLDGTPRVVASWFHWANPDVAVSIDTDAFPPEVLSIRGRASLTELDGIVPEYALAADRYLGEEEAIAYLAQIDHPSTRMARIAVRPTWVGVLDFQTRLPSALGGVTA